MPVATELRIEAKDAKQGDHIPGGNIESVTRKDKYTYFKLDTGRNVRHEHTTPIIVTREVPTDEEKAEKEAADKQRWFELMTEDVTKAITRSHAVVAKAVAELEKASTSRIDSQWSYIGDYLSAVAQRDIWATVERRTGHTFEDGGESYTITLADAIETEAQEIEHNLLNDYWRGGSTSSASNLAVETRRAVSSSWLRSYNVVAMRKFANTDKIGRNR